MRVLFTTFAAPSHLQNMVTMAWALQTAGHEVRVASQPDLADAITSAGLTAVPVGESHDVAQQVQEINDNLDQENVAAPQNAGDAGLDMNELRPEKLTREYMLKVFGTMTPFVFQNCSPDGMIDDLVAFSRHWRPDLVVWDTFTFAGPIAARACGAAHARLIAGLDLMGAMRTRFVADRDSRPAAEREDPLRDWLASRLERHGAAYDDEVATGQWTITPTPRSLSLPVPLRYVPVRFVPYSGRSVVPDWLREPPRRKRVCLTLGLSYRDMWGGVSRLGEMLSAVADLDVEVVAALSADQREALGDMPGNVRMVDFVPLSAVLPDSAAIIHHGGVKTFGTAMACAVPQLIVPEGQWDTAHLARRAEDGGFGLSVGDARGIEPKEFARLVARLVDEPSFARAARSLRRESLTMPAPNEIVPSLEALTAEHRAQAG
ncbi:activator-dependent family glycosyltransferase [Spirillospora sp. NPDC048832]